MGSIKNLASQTAIYGISSIAGRFLNVLLVPIYTRVFNVEDFGINVYLYAYISFFNILLTHGMETAFFRFADKQNHQKAYSSSFLSVLFASAAFTIFIFFTGNKIGSYLGFQNKMILLWLVAGILICDAISAIPFALLRHLNKALRFAIIKNLNIAINIFINLYILLLAPYLKNKYQISLPFYVPSPGIEYIFIANFIASLSTLVLLLPQILKVTFRLDFSVWKSMIKYALPMMIVGFAGMINETLDRIMIKFFYSDIHTANGITGIYGAVYKLSIIITVFIQAFKYAAEPFFFSHARQSNKRDIYATVMNYFVVVCLTIFLIVVLFMHYIKHFIGSQFHSGLHVVPILLTANIFLGIYYNLSVWYKLSDNTSKGAQISIIGAIITIFLNAFLIPKIGYVGCAIATLACYASMTVISYLWGNKYYPIPYHITKIAMYFFVAFGIYMLFVLVVEPNLSNQLLKNVVSIILILLFIGFAFVKEKTYQYIK